MCEQYLAGLSALACEEIDSSYNSEPAERRFLVPASGPSRLFGARQLLRAGRRLPKMSDRLQCAGRLRRRLRRCQQCAVVMGGLSAALKAHPKRRPTCCADTR